MHERDLLGDRAEAGCEPLVLDLGQELLKAVAPAITASTSLAAAVCSPCWRGALLKERRPGSSRERPETTGRSPRRRATRRGCPPVVGLVDHEGLVLGKHLAPGAQVGTEKMEVDNDDVGRSGPRPAASAKHSPPEGQRRAPGYSSAATLRLDHA